MARTGRPGLSGEQKRELWTRWKQGQSLSDIGRALGKHAASVLGVVAAKGGIAPAARTRSQAALTMEEREDISRGLVAGLSLRQIAAQLGRAPSTVSLRNPTQTSRRFRSIPAGDSDGSQPLIPMHSSHP